MIEERRIITILAKEFLRGMSLPEWTFFTEGLHFVQEDLLGCAYSIFAFEPLYNSLKGIPKHLSECAFTYLKSDAECSYSGKPVDERRPLSKMQMSIWRSANRILAAMKR